MSYQQKWEEKWIPDLTSWATTGVTGPFSYSKVLKINNVLYAFGGYDIVAAVSNGKIWSTSWYDPTGWTYTGSTFAAFSDNIDCGVVNNTVYSWGRNGYTAIWSAPISDPLNWSDTGVTNPSPRDNTGLIITPNHIAFHGGYNGFALGNTSYASISTPTSISTGGSIAGWERYGFYLDGEEVYLTGGFNATGYFESIDPRSPTTKFYSRTSNTNLSAARCPAIFHVGNYVYIFGTNNDQTLYYCNTDDFSNTWRMASSIIPVNVQYVSGGQWIGPDGYAYFITTAGVIYKSGRRKIYVTDPQIPGVYSHRRAIYADTGEDTYYTIHCQMGMTPWYTNRRDRF